MAMKPRMSGFIGLCLVVTAQILAAPVSWAKTLSCSDSEGKLLVNRWNYDGGARPYPGMVISRETWSLNGTQIGEEIRRESRPLEESVLAVSWYDQSRVELEEIRLPSEAMVSQVYSQKVSLSRKDGASLIEGQPDLVSLFKYMICTYRFNSIPHP